MSAITVRRRKRRQELREQFPEAFLPPQTSPWRPAGDRVAAFSGAARPWRGPSGKRDEFFRLTDNWPWVRARRRDAFPGTLDDSARAE